jgi:hypothetical protein
MNRRLSVSILLSLIFIGSILSLLSTTKAQTSVAMLDSMYTDEEMEIDGVLEEHEYDKNLVTNYTLYDYADQNNQKEITLYSVYDEENVYIGMSVEDTIGYKEFWIILRVNEAINNFYNHTTGHFTLGNDIKAVSSSNSSNDMFTQTFYESDVNNGGINNTEGKSRVTETGYIFEIKFPLDSGDTYGYDVSLEKNDEIEFFLYYYSFDEFTQAKTTDDSEDYGTLYLAPPSPNISSYPALLIIVSILGVSAILVLKHRRK